MIATCGPGDEVIVPAPYWVSYPEMCRLAGAEPVVVTTTADEGFLLTADKLRATLNDKSRLLILCSPSNPSGAVYTKEALEAIADVVRSHPRLLVLADEIYEHIIYEPAKHFSFAALPGMREANAHRQRILQGFRHDRLAPRIPRRAAALRHRDRQDPGTDHVRTVVHLPGGGDGGAQPREVRRRARGDDAKKPFRSVGCVCQRLAKIEGVKLASPQGAFYVFPDVSGLVGDGCVAEGFGPIADADALCEYLLEKAQVALVPGSAFGNPECLRISYAASDETLREALDRIEKALAAEVYVRG